jgi:hypothetical protein
MYLQNKTSLEFLVGEKKSFTDLKFDKAAADEKFLDEGMLNRYNLVESSVVNDIGFDASKTFAVSGNSNNLDIRRVFGVNILNLSGNPKAKDVDSIYVRRILSCVIIILITKELE